MTDPTLSGVGDVPYSAIRSLGMLSMALLVVIGVITKWFFICKPFLW